jgi:AcrR family transcriptional regulator
MANPAPSPLAPRGRGRPREFDVDAALAKAARVFRERGYHATSISDLTEAMQLASGSVYKAFKDKRAVFLAAFDREAGIYGDKVRDILNADKPGRDRMRDLLTVIADLSHGVEGKRGCLLVGCAAELDTFDSEIARRVTTALRKRETQIIELLRQGRADRSIPSTIDVNATARLMLCVLQGMRVIAKTGRSRAEMGAIVDTAMKLLG